MLKENIWLHTGAEALQWVLTALSANESQRVRSDSTKAKPITFKIAHREIKGKSGSVSDQHLLQVQRTLFNSTTGVSEPLTVNLTVTSGRQLATHIEVKEVLNELLTFLRTDPANIDTQANVAAPGVNTNVVTAVFVRGES